jgi:hypothetical protein
MVHDLNSHQDSQPDAVVKISMVMQQYLLVYLLLFLAPLNTLPLGGQLHFDVISPSLVSLVYHDVQQ